jgi:hypothetical protein
MVRGFGPGVLTGRDLDARSRPRVARTWPMTSTLRQYAARVVLAPVLVVLIVGLWVAGFVYWIVALVQVARIPDYQYRAAGTDKTVWVLVVALVGIIGALVWTFAKRRDVLAAQGLIPAPPPGWYPEVGTGALRWWDGAFWSDVRHVPPPPRSVNTP